MRHVALVAVVDGLHDLAPEELCLQFRHLPVGFHFEIAVQTAAIDELHNEEDLLVRLESFVQLRDVRMVQLFHYFHLSLHALPPVRLHEFDLFVDLDGDLLVEHLVETESHDCVGSLSDPLADEVIVQVLDCAVGSAEFNNFLIWLPLTFINLGLVQWMSIEDFAGVVCSELLNHSLLLRLQGVAESVHISGLNCGSFWHDQGAVCIILLVLLRRRRSHVRNVRHVLRPIQFVRGQDFEVSRLAHGSDARQQPLDFAIVLLDDNVVLPCADIFIHCQAATRLVGGFAFLCCLVDRLWLLGHSVPLVVLQVVKLDLPEIRTICI